MSARRLVDRDGFTLAEILAAMAVITVGLLAMAGALSHGLSGIETGRGESAAVFLAEDKLEQLRAIALVDWGNPALQPGTTVEYCWPSGSECAATPTADSLRRTTLITGGDATCSPRCRVLSVSVFYRAITALGQLDQERRVDLHTMVVSRA